MRRRRTPRRRVRLSQYLRQSASGPYADLQAYKRAAVEIAKRHGRSATARRKGRWQVLSGLSRTRWANLHPRSSRPTRRSGSSRPIDPCAFCGRPIPKRTLMFLDECAFHVLCASRLLRNETLVLKVCAQLARDSATVAVERAVRLVREARSLRNTILPGPPNWRRQSG
jgi:hypothetical protein